MKQHMQRLPKTALQRQRMSDARKGIKKSPEHRAKIAAALAGRPKSPDHRAKIGDARRARPSGLSPDQIIAATKHRNDMIVAGHARRRFKQWGRDLRAARMLGDEDLRRDVRRSWGWHSKRRYLGFPGVSDGFSKDKGNKVVWSPYPYVRLAKVATRGKSVSRCRGRAARRLSRLREAGMAPGRA